MIKVSSLNKYYNKGKSNEIHVINNVSLMLPDTGFISILGKSGSGKTTLLNVIGGLDRANGVICYDDVKVKNYNMNKIDKFRREYIGYVFQNYNLLKSRTVWENLEIALEAINITDKEEVKKRIDYSLKAVGLYKFRKKPAFALSGGQMQRVSIARALVKNSKIIIADEPTGNLDSDNSVEIMNILKKISKKSLVLLVTHDKQLAEFYSDRIIELCDGKIENIRETTNDATLKGIYDSNKIYLEDFEKKDGGDEFLKYHLYLDGDISNLELTFIKRNNQIYLESNQKIKLLEDSNLKVFEQRTETDKESVVDSFEYDTSFYNDKKSKNIVKSFFKNIKSAIKNFFITRKRTKFFHFAFFLIGIVIATLNITFVSYSKISSENLMYDKNIYGIENYTKFTYDEEKHNSYKEFIIDAFKQGEINKFYPSSSMSTYGTMSLSSFDNRNININFLAFYDDLIQNCTMIYGQRSQNKSEIVLSKTLADQFIKKLDFNYEDYRMLIGKKISCSNGDNFVIVGVVDSDSVAGYYKFDYVSNNTYYYNLNPDDFSNYKAYKYINNASEEYIIKSGRNIESNLEGLVSDSSSINIGDKVGDVLIVGKYKTQLDELNENDTGDGNNQAMIISNITGGAEVVLVNENTISYIENFQLDGYNQTYFSVNSLESIQNMASEKGFKVLNSFDYIKGYLMEENRESKYTLLPVIAILLGITLIYIYFSTRSKMINDIYTIGVFRALGFSRKRIIAKYACEILVTTILTSLLGYILVSAIYDVIAVKLTDLGVLMLTVSDFYSTYVVAAALLVTNIFFGLIPVTTLMKKSPSEIISKYDI